MLKPIFTSCFLFTLSLINAQQNTDCSKILDEVPSFMRADQRIRDSLFGLDMKVIRHCGDLNSTDTQLLIKSVIGMVIVSCIHDSEAFTYRTIIQGINRFKTMEEYQILLESFKTKQEMEEFYPIEIKDLNWAKLNDILVRMTMTYDEIETFKTYCYKSENTNLTLKMVFTKFNKQSKSVEYIAYQKENPFHFKKLMDYESAVTESKNTNKKLLIYFTGYGCMGSRKSDTLLLNDNEIIGMLSKHFLVYKAYVDDRTALPVGSQYISKYSNRKVTTYGLKWMELESEKFNHSVTPYFIILDLNGNLIADLSIFMERNTFINFLNQGLR